MPSFVRIGLLVQKLKGDTLKTQTHEHIDIVSHKSTVVL
jgi:hypothetical protein